MLTPTSVTCPQVVVDAIDPSVIVSQSASKVVDFGIVAEPELTNFSIPLELQIGQLYALCDCLQAWETASDSSYLAPINDKVSPCPVCVQRSLTGPRQEPLQTGLVTGEGAGGVPPF